MSYDLPRNAHNTSQGFDDAANRTNWAFSWVFYRAFISNFPSVINFSWSGVKFITEFAKESQRFCLNATIDLYSYNVFGLKSIPFVDKKYYLYHSSC